MTRDEKSLAPRPSASTDVAAFLRAASSVAVRKGRLLFALDATASRQPTWDEAARIQGEMFRTAESLGGLEVQLAYYRGLGEFRASPWVAEATKLRGLMAEVSCEAGQTQIERVLRHAQAEARRTKLGAVVFVGDCMEENPDALAVAAGELAVLGVPVYLFHEGDDPAAGSAFRQIARLTRGACCRFDASSPHQLKELLGAVAVYAAGGRKALESYAQLHGGLSVKLLEMHR